MPFRPCVSGCSHYLVPGDGHICCLSCLGIKHTEVAFVDESCSHCGGMTVAELPIRLRFLQRGGVPVPLPRSRVPPGGCQGSATSGSSRAGLTVKVRNSPPSRALPASGNSLPVELPREHAGPSQGVPLISFGAPPDDQMSIAASEGESDHSGNDDLAPLPPSGQSTVPDSDPKMVAMLARAAERVGLGGGLHRVLNPRGWMIGFLGWPALVLRAPTRCHSSRRCIMSSLERGWHLSLREIAPGWSGRLRCNCVQILLSPGTVNRCSPPGPVGTRRPWPAVLMQPAEKLLSPYMLWRCCRFTRPRQWGTCTRVATTQKFRSSPLTAQQAQQPPAKQPARPGTPPNLAASIGASGPETDDPVMGVCALREMVNAPLPPPEEGQFLFSPPLAPHQWYPKPWQKSSFLYLWVSRGDGGLWTSQSWVTLTLLSCKWAAVGGLRGRSVALLTHPLPERR